METAKPDTSSIVNALLPNPLDALKDELSAALSLYWQSAGRVLQSSGVNLSEPPNDYYFLEKNFFSALFLFSYHRTGIVGPRRITYAAINQCLRGMVTGCDNILDDEYKKTLETDLPEKGDRFRSVLDIMVSERILFDILLDAFKTNEMPHAAVLKIGDAALHALFRSGAQEASEENGNSHVLHPEQVLSTVHHYKTGLLFQSPWAIPMVVENGHKDVIHSMMDALYKIGMGCQILDDMVDLASDLHRRRHNYLVSLIYHDDDSSHWKSLCRKRSSQPGVAQDVNLVSLFPEALSIAGERARVFLVEGLGGLFGSDNLHFVAPAISFLSQRIGTDRFTTLCDT